MICCLRIRKIRKCNGEIDNSISYEMRKKKCLCLKKGVYGVWVITMHSMHEHFTWTKFYQCLKENKMSKKYTCILYDYS